MQIQPIQSTNNYQKPNFKAYFINDTKGRLMELWEAAEKDSALFQKIENFAGEHVKHALEIVSTREGYAYVCSGADKTKALGKFYKVLNHYTGKTSEYFTSSYASKRLYDILGWLEKDHQIYNNDYLAASYRFLTGQEMPAVPEI